MKTTGGEHLRHALSDRNVQDSIRDRQKLKVVRLAFAKKNSVLLSLLLLPNIVTIIIAASVVVVTIASNDE